MSANRFPVLAPRILGPLAGLSLLALLIGVTLLPLVHRRQAGPAASGYRLYLEAPVNPYCYYGTAWSQGPVITTRDPRLEETTFVRHFRFIDGCFWQATETLTPGDDGQLKYEYREQVLSCRPHAIPAATCPRNGTIVVEPLESTQGLRPTPAVSTMPHSPQIHRHKCLELRSVRHACSPDDPLCNTLL